MANPRKPEDDIYNAGAATRRALGESFDQQKRVAGNIALQASKPFLAPGALAAPFVMGLAGAEPARAPAPAPAAASSRPRLSATPAARGPEPAAGARPAAAPGPEPVMLPAVSAIKPGDPNTYTFDGRTRTVEPAPMPAAGGTAQPTLRAPLPAVATRSTQPVAQEATQRAVQGQRSAALDVRADAASILNPMSQGAELMRRLENVSTTSQFKGSPSARNDARQVIMGQLAAQNQGSADGQQGINATLRQGAGGEMDAAEAFATRRDSANQFNVDAELATRELQQRGQSPTETVRGADGRVSVLRNDGSAFTLRNEEGEAVIAEQEGRRPDIVTADTQYKALGERLAALQAFGRPSQPEAAAEYDQSVAAIESQMTQLTGGGVSGGVPPYASFVQAIKARNPGATDDQIRAFYATEYPGATAQ